MRRLDNGGGMPLTRLESVQRGYPATQSRFRYVVHPLGTLPTLLNATVPLRPELLPPVNEYATVAAEQLENRERRSAHGG